MNTRREFLIGFGAGLLLAVGGIVLASDGKGAASPSPSDMVRTYLAARARHDLAGQYALFSAKFRGEMPLTQFEEWSAPLSSPAEAGVSPLLASVSVFFMDAHGASGYRFAVVGPDPGDPHTVLVRALPPGAPLDKAFLLKIVTAPENGGGPRLEMLPSFQKTNPRDFVVMTEHAHGVSSLSNLKQIGLALIMYAQEHGDHLPDADGWVDAILPQLGTEALFHDHSAPEDEPWNYAFNCALSGVRLGGIKDPAVTVMVFESVAGEKNTADLGLSVPRPGRHAGGTDYLFADGHVKWYPDGAALNFSPTVK